MDSEWWRSWEFRGTDCGWRNNWVSFGQRWWYVLVLPFGINWHIHTKLVLIQTDVQELWSPSTAFLSTMRQKGYALFAPGRLDAPVHRLPSTQLALPCSRMLAFNHHDSMSSWGVSPRGFVDPSFRCDKSFHSRVCLTNLSLRHNISTSAIKKYLEQERMPIWLGFPNC